MKIYEDEKIHEDLLIGDFEESFYNMTMKDSMLLTWAKSGCTVPFIFKGLKILQLNPCLKSYYLNFLFEDVSPITVGLGLLNKFFILRR